MNCCTSLTVQGHPCRAQARRGSTYCQAHESMWLECIGGPWDGLALCYHEAVVYLTYTPAKQGSRWCGWGSAVAVGNDTRGAYVRRDRAWSWKRSYSETAIVGDTDNVNAVNSRS